MLGNNVRTKYSLDTKQAEQALEKMNGKFKALGSLKGPLIAAGAIAGIGVAAAAATYKVSQAAASMQLSMNKVSVVFGDQMPVIAKWSKEVASGMGVSSLEVQKLSANFQDLLIPMGFTREAATKMTMDVVGLSAALSEWSGGKKTAAEVSDILAKAMLGEREQLKTLGISIMENDVVQRVATMGMKDATGAARQQARAIATQQLIFERSTDAQEAFAKGGDSLARQMMKLKSAIQEVKDKAIVALIPLMETLNKTMVDSVLPTLENSILPWFEKDFPVAVEKAIDAIKSFIDWNQSMARVNKKMMQEMDIDEGGTHAKLLRMSNLLAEVNPIRDIQKSMAGMTIMKGAKISETAGWTQRDHMIAAEESYQEALEKSTWLVNQITTSFEGMSNEFDRFNREVPQATEAIRTHIDPIAQETIEMYATIHETAAGVAEEIRAVANQTLEGQKYFQKEMMLAQINGDTDRLNFLKKNQREILDQVKIQTAELAAAYEFSPELLQTIDIAGILTDHLWNAHLEGVKAALAEEERLKQERYSQAMKNASDTQKLALAITESIRRAQRDGTYEYGQRQEMYRYAGARGQLQRWMFRDEDDPTSGYWGALAGGVTDHPIQTKHSGGMVSGPVGSEQRVRALGGETVLPIGAKAGAVTINFNGLVAGDPVAIGQEIARIVNKSSQSNGAIINGSAVTS